MNYSHLRADVVGSPHHVHHYHPLDNRPSTSGSDERMTHRDHVHHHHHCLPASAVAATESEQPMQVCEDVEMKDLAIPHGCSEDCSACRELSHVVDMSLRCKPPPVPPVVLVGRLPDATVVNAWPPFGCRGRGQHPSQSCVGPICFRRRKTPTSENVNDAGASDDPPTKIHCKNVQYPCDAFLVMNDLRKSSGHTLCDVKLQAGRHIFPAHRIVLAAASSYFRAMFTMGMKEASEDIVRMEKICPRILGKLIDFCYTSEITIGEKFVCKILPAAVMLQMQHVIDCCCHFLESQLDPCNALGIADFANQHGCTSLTKTAREFIDKHFADVSESEEFLQQSVCQLINLIKRDELVVKSESEVYNAVMLWIKYDEKNRRPHLEDIVYVVRCYFLSPDFLEQQLKSCEVLKSHPNCRQRSVKVLTGRVYAAGGGSAYSTQALGLVPRGHVLADADAVAYLSQWSLRGFCSRPSSTWPVDAAPSRKATRTRLPWTRTTRFPTLGGPAAQCLWRGVARGRRPRQPILRGRRCRCRRPSIDREKRYNPNDETWSPIADMSRARLGLGVASLNRLL
ncbi:Kelch-like ECH-associated protein 1 [Hypsibius exemplaris]|uniref:Kelch-like ECH-associated protein 1 n=1 Tax=Hypsibius exemplaris TaxID=2072580 RepID=A0A9X6NE64_HYPEX|nr:Kelch-like ECH-associated protein 1 [Hypsibius exemplaris]